MFSTYPMIYFFPPMRWITKKPHPPALASLVHQSKSLPIPVPEPALPRPLQNPQTTSSVHMESYTLAYVLGSILPSIPADRLFAHPTCRCSGQNGRLSGCIFWNKCRRSNCHCRWSGMSTLAPSASRSVLPGTTHALFPTVYGWQKN